MKKPIFWITPNHMLMDSGYKTFDRQCRAILTGQQIGDVVTSAYVRSYDDTECNGHTFKPGHLQNFDLDFVGAEAMPLDLRNQVSALATKGDLLLYKFFHVVASHTVIDGYVATKNGHCVLKSVIGKRRTSALVINEAARYISDDADCVNHIQYLL